MNGDRLQQLVYKGYSKAAMRIGFEHGIYRSATAINPINPSNLQGTTLVSANVSWEYMRANKYGNAVWQLVADGRELQRFDYLVGSSTYFVAGMQPLLPILGVECNKIVTVKRPYQQPGKGYQGYSGNTAATEETLMQNCPASILENSNGESSPAKIPGDTKMPWMRCLLPYLGGVIIKTGDIVIDEIGTRYVISGDELTDLGWRLTIQEVGA